MILPEAVFAIPPFVDWAVTDAPLRAFVPSSILTLPLDARVLDIFPRSRNPFPEIVMFSVGRIRPLTTMPLILPEALHVVNVSFQLIADESDPLPTTVPVPIVVAPAMRMFDKKVTATIAAIAR